MKMRKYRVIMTEVVTYRLEVECDDDDMVTDVAEEQFVQGHYETTGQSERKVVDWELIDEAGA